MRVNYKIERYCANCSAVKPILARCPDCHKKMRTKPFQKRPGNLEYRSFEGY